ncbi:hypothetical protein BN1221_02733c [Brenneria goodwinii]|uniref:Uncharacterized protein n=1 Tax=Brenneria goodwinii TaxID=1109412 RepID=A0A0G4JWK6_9GAMM|nr:hypothetical protein BN1221_02733c [Brenneria goodwinii]
MTGTKSRTAPRDSHKPTKEEISSFPSRQQQEQLDSNLTYITHAISQQKPDIVSTDSIKETEKS